MKKTKITLTAILLVIMMLFSVSVFADNDTNVVNNTTNETNETTENTTNEETNNTVGTTTNAPEKEIHDGNYYEVGGNVTIDKIINGNTFVVGNNVTITGAIQGDLFVTASTLTIDGGAIQGNVIFAGSKMVLNGTLFNLYAVCDTFICEYDGMTALDLHVVANNITFAGYIERNIYFTANKSLTLTDDAYIIGNLTYHANNTNISEKASIYGKTDASALGAKESNFFTIANNYVFSLVSTLTFVFIIWLVMLLLTPKFVDKATGFGVKKPFSSLGIGILVLLVVPIVSVLLMLISPLTSISMILMALYILLISITFTITSLVIANFLNNKFIKHKTKNSMAWYVLLVAAVLWALKQIPIVGFILTILITIMGIGMFVLGIISKKKLYSSDDFMPEAVTETTETSKTPIEKEMNEEKNKTEKPKKDENKE